MSKPRHIIRLVKYDEHTFRWVYEVSGVVQCRSPRTYTRLSNASQAARLFRERLVSAGECSIESPPGHVYSGAKGYEKLLSERKASK